MDRLGRKTILLVEDEAIIAMNEEAQLVKRGYAVVTANSADTALRIAREDHSLDLVLMDIDLGTGMDGGEVAAMILAGRDIPLIFLSSHTEAELVRKSEEITSYGYIVKNSGISVLDASIKMAFKLFEANRGFREANRRLEATFAALPDPLFELALDGTYLDVPSNLAGLLYDDPSALIGKRVHEVLPAEAAAVVESALEEANATGHSFGTCYSLTVPSGRRDFEISASRMDSDGAGSRFVFLARDVTERKRAEEGLRKEKERLHNVLAATRAGTCEWNIQTGEAHFDEASASLLGYGPGELGLRSFDTWMSLKHPEDRAKVDEELERHVRGETEFYSTLSRARHKDGSWVWVHGRGKVIEWDKEGKPLRMFGTHMSVTDMKRAEVEIQKLLAEKENLLREVHHRVKNNMGTMISLLALESSSVRDPAAAKALVDAENRLRSMGILYDRLYQSTGFDAMPARDYFPSLLRQVVEVFPNRDLVEVETEIDDIILGVNELAPLGILVNEIVTNAMKYAFVGRRRGRIRLSVESRDGRVRLVLGDDGEGMPACVDIDRPTGFGLILVGNLARQLGASLRLEREGGTTYVLEFEPTQAGSDQSRSATTSRK